LQAKHAAVQALLQQTPSAHWPLAHSAVPVQGCPVGRFT
jgi:hypothetical protein